MTNLIGAKLIGIGFVAALGSAIYYIETHHEIAHFRLFSFGAAFLCFAIATALLRGRLRPAALLVASSAFGVMAVEATATLIEPSSDITGLFEYDVRTPIVGWDNGPAGAYAFARRNLQTGAPIYDVTYTIDEHHDRLTKSNPSGPSVAFFGESFTFGDGVKDSETMPQRFADLLGGRQRVLNLAVSGYSPAQVLAELQYGLKDDVIGNNPIAFVMLTGGFHIARTACKESWTIRAPRYEARDGRMVFVGACAEGAVAQFRRFLEQTSAYRVFIKPLRVRVNRADIETYIDIVAEVARTAKAKYGVEMVVPYLGGPIPAPKSLQHEQMKLIPVWAYLAPATGYDDDKIIAALRRRGVRVVDMTLRDEAMGGHQIGIPNDGHPTPFAHARRAEMTLAALNALKVPLARAEKATEGEVSAAE